MTSQGPLPTRQHSFLGVKLHLPEASSSAKHVLYATGGPAKPKDGSKPLQQAGQPTRLAESLHPAMARKQDEARSGVPLRAQGPPAAEVRLILYHWTHSFSSQKVTASSGGPPSGSGPGQLPRRDL